MADASDPFSRALGALELLRLPVAVGSSFVQANKVLDGVVDVDNDGRADPLTMNSTATLIDRGPITIAAGTFNDVLRVIRHVSLKPALFFAMIYLLPQKVSRETHFQGFRASAIFELDIDTHFGRSLLVSTPLA